MSRFDLSRRARADLVEIGVYGADRWGTERSEQYVTALYATFQLLAEGGARGRSCDRIQPGLWRIERASHVVFFRHVPTGVFICRVLHRRQLPQLHRIDDE